MMITSGQFRSRGQLQGQGRGGLFDRGSTKHSGIFYAYRMDSAPLHIFENQVIPMGLHDISKGFRPNLATTRVILWEQNLLRYGKKPKYINLFQNFKIFQDG